MSKRQIESDLEKIEKMLNYFFGGGRQRENYRITEEDYLNPGINDDIVMPMNHSLGMFMYFRNLRDTLRKAVKTGVLDESEIPPGAPSYVEQLVR